jgi:hypothetical protein
LNAPQSRVDAAFSDWSGLIDSTPLNFLFRLVHALGREISALLDRTTRRRIKLKIHGLPSNRVPIYTCGGGLRLR